MDWTCVNGDLVLNNFLLVDKLISCFKTYIVGYDALHTKGSEVFGFVCLLGFFFHWFAIAYHLIRKQRTWIRTRIFGMLIVMAAGVFLLCRGMVIPKSNAWHTNVVPAITIVIVLIDGVIVMRSQVGSSMSTLIGIFLTGLMVYNAGIISKVTEWRRKKAQVSAVYEDGNVEDRVAEAGADVELALRA